MRIVTVLAALLVVAGGFAIPATARDDKPQATNVIVYPSTGLTTAEIAKYVPASTRVAILPAVDRTGERAENRRLAQAKTAYENMVEQFTNKGFQIVSQDEVNAAVAKLGMDLNDEEEYRRENFYSVANAVNADLVIFAVVTDAGQGTKSGGLFGSDELQGKARVKFWLLDAKSKKAVFSAVVKEGKAGGKSKLFATNEGNNRQINSVGNAVKELLEPFLAPYPNK